MTRTNIGQWMTRIKQDKMGCKQDLARNEERSSER